MRAITRKVEDGRRATELDRRSAQDKFSSTPGLKHLRDGQVVVIAGAGQIVWRDGNKRYFFTGTEVT